MEIENSKNTHNQLSIKNYIKDKKGKDKSKENINNIEKPIPTIKIKSKKIFKNKMKLKKINKKNNKKKRKKSKTDKTNGIWNVEIYNILDYLKIIKFDELDPLINKFSPLKTIHPNVIWHLNNLLYFNNKLNFKKENFLKNFYKQIENIDNTKLNNTKINYSLITQILNSNKLFNSNTFLKNFKNVNNFENFDLIEDLKFINNFNKLKNDYININDTNDFKKIPINCIIENVLKKIKNNKEKINNKFIKLEKESKLNFEKESKFLINPLNKVDNIYRLVKEEKIYIDFMEKMNKKVIPNQNIIEKYYCHICNNSENNYKNEIIFCSFCNISMHTKCYSLNSIPTEEDWICEVCKEFGDLGKYVPCSLCPMRGGVLKKTTLKLDSNFFEKKNLFYHDYLLRSRNNFKYKNKDLIKEEIKNKINLNKLNKKELFYEYISEKEYNLANEKNIISTKIWAHLSCSYWSPQMHINGKNINEILGIIYIDKKRFEMPCIICKQTNGASIKCSSKICLKYFHVECARRKGYYLEIYSYEGKNFNIYCNTHKPFQLKRLVDLREKKLKEDIEKFCSNLLRYLKERNLLENKTIKLNNLKTFKKEKNWEVEELVNFLNPEQIFFLNKIKNYIFNHQKNCFKIKLKNNKIIETTKPEKNFLIQDIGKIYQIFGKYGKEFNFKFDNIYKFYLNIIKCIKDLQNKENSKKISFLKKKYEEKMLTVENYSKNNNNELGKNNCICNKPWIGELMIECEKCKWWFHPNCQNIDLNNLDAKNINFICLICSEEKDL